MRLVSTCGQFEAWVEIDKVEQEIYQSKNISGQDPRSEAYLISPNETVRTVHECLCKDNQTKMFVRHIQYTSMYLAMKHNSGGTAASRN